MTRRQPLIVYRSGVRGERLMGADLGGIPQRIEMIEKLADPVLLSELEEGMAHLSEMITTGMFYEGYS